MIIKLMDYISRNFNKAFCVLVSLIIFYVTEIQGCYIALASLGLSVATRLTSDLS